jgi:hypothetical protein
MTITRVIVRQVSDRRADERRQGERRVQVEAIPMGFERRRNAEFRVAPRRQAIDRRAAFA